MVTGCEKLCVTAAILWALLAATLAWMLASVMDSMGEAPVEPEPIPTVYDRKDDAIVYVKATCPTCRETAPSVDGAVMCVNPECPAYGIPVQAS